MSPLTVLLLAGLAVTSAWAGCKQIDRCCDGMESDCRATMASQGKSKNQYCFCDEHCLVTGDCCDDFQSHCKKVDCEMGPWGPFSKCSVNCGYGHMKKERRVFTQPKNGGKSCPNTYHRKFCYGTKCKFARGVIGGAATLRELAKVMPLSYSTIRDSPAYNGHNGIRKYVFNIDGKDARYSKATTKAMYKLVRANKKCRLNQDWRKAFVVNAVVCVQCDPTAMRAHKDYTCKGQGVEGQTTRWMTVGNRGCRGEWKLMNERVMGECTDSQNSFIFI